MAALVGRVGEGRGRKGKGILKAVSG